MPRTRRTESGAPAQSMQTGAPGVRYGEGKDLAAMREAAPIPNNRAGSPSPPAPQQPGLPAEATSQPSSPMPKPGLLTAPTIRPNEPLTAGLRSGPGAGPEGLQVAPAESPLGKFLRDLSAQTGRTVFAEMARRSNL